MCPARSGQRPESHRAAGVTPTINYATVDLLPTPGRGPATGQGRNRTLMARRSSMAR